MRKYGRNDVVRFRENENNFDCHPLWRWPTLSYWDQPIDSAEIISQFLSYDFQTYHNVSSTVFVSITSLSSCKPGQLQENVPLYDENSKIKPIFRIDSKNQLSLTFHSFVENFWDVKEEIRPFCVDYLLLKQERIVFYTSQVFRCITLEPFLNYRPAILLISIVALLMTFVIYFFVPASGEFDTRIAFNIIRNSNWIYFHRCFQINSTIEGKE